MYEKLFGETKKSEVALAGLYIMGGALGIIASMTLLVDTIELIKNPSYVPPCNINPVVSCGTEMKSAQAYAFGIPNPAIGLVAFPVLVTVGVSMLAGAKFKKWFWQLFSIAGFAAVVLVHWFFYESLWSIGAVCPWCMVVWSIAIPVFWYTTLYNFASGHIKAPRGADKLVDFAQRYQHVVVVLWFAAIGGAILQRFWYYFKTVM